MPEGKKKVYIAGPITGLPQDVYEANFARAAETLRKDGYDPVNPAGNDPDCGKTCATGLVLDDGSFCHSWMCYMKTGITQLMQCDAIHMLEGWKQSQGARLEFCTAVEVGLEVIL